MPKNIKDIVLHVPPNSYNGMKLVRINFEFPCEYTVLHISDLKQILRLWIKGEEERYLQSQGFRGRLMLFDEIKKIFDEVE